MNSQTTINTVIDKLNTKFILSNMRYMDLNLTESIKLEDYQKKKQNCKIYLHAAEVLLYRNISTQVTVCKVSKAMSNSSQHHKVNVELFTSIIVTRSRYSEENGKHILCIYFH